MVGYLRGLLSHYYAQNRGLFTVSIARLFRSDPTFGLPLVSDTSENGENVRIWGQFGTPVRIDLRN